MYLFWWKVLTIVIGSDKDWWTYISYLYTNCKGHVDRKCSRKGIESIGIEYDDIDDCVTNSFDEVNHALSDNRILSKESEEWKKGGPSFAPALIINNITYRGYLSPDNVFEAICQGFKKHPSECNTVTGETVHIFDGISTEM